MFGNSLRLNQSWNDAGTSSGEGWSAARRFVYCADTIIQPIILIVAILSNIGSLYILPGTRIARPLRVYLITLSISDLCAATIGLCHLIILVARFGGEMPFGFWEPYAVAIFTLYYITLIFICTSATLVNSLAVIRCLLIAKPLSARVLFSTRRARAACLFIFIATVILYLPTTLNVISESCFKDFSTPVCQRLHAKVPNSEKVAEGYFYFLTILFGPLSLVVNIICFVIIRVALSKTHKTLEKISTISGELKQLREESNRKITNMLLVILVLDFICSLPLCVQAIGVLVAPNVGIFDKTRYSYSVFESFTEIFIALRPAYNFWLYTFAVKDFRHSFKKLLRRPYQSCRLLGRACWNVQETGASESRERSVDSEGGGGRDRRGTSFSTNVTTTFTISPTGQNARKKVDGGAGHDGGVRLVEFRKRSEETSCVDPFAEEDTLLIDEARKRLSLDKGELYPLKELHNESADV